MADVTLTRDELEAIVKRASGEAVRDVMRKLGVPDDEVSAAAWRRDMRETRELLDAWRLTKRTVLTTALKWATGLLLAAIAIGVGAGLGAKLH